jgi:hypothetical protein
MPFTSPFKNAVLGVIGGTTFTGITCYIGWLSAVTNAKTPTVTEMSYAGYARSDAVAFDAVEASSNGGGRMRKNTALEQGGQKTDAGTVNAIALGIYDASGGGNLYFDGYLGSVVAKLAAVPTTGTFACPNHGLVVGNTVRLEELVFSDFPTGVSEDTEYTLATQPDGDTFTLTGVTISGDGACAVLPYTAVPIGQNGTPQVAAGALKVEL